MDESLGTSSTSILVCGTAKEEDDGVGDAAEDEDEDEDGEMDRVAVDAPIPAGEASLCG
jgi:hypothetical protein